MTGGGGDLAAGAAFGSGAAAGQVGAVKLSAGAEFDLIRRILDGVPPRPDVAVGPGEDDAAVLGESGVVLSSDLSVENRHFRRGWLTPFEIGYRAAAASLSDLAAMAARPIGVLASLSISAADAGDFAVEIMRGVRAAVESVGGGLLGGDLTSSPGPIFLDVVSVGQTSKPIRRAGARVGDELWVTGLLGGAALAVESLLGGGEVPAEAMTRFASPVPRVREAIWLADRELPAAMLDISDGLGGDAGHLAAANGVAVVLDPATLPLHPSLRSIEPARAFELALSGGEDYELCFAARSGSVAPHLEAFRTAFGCELTQVGRIEAGEGVFLERPDGRNRLENGGFQHFGSTR